MCIKLTVNLYIEFSYSGTFISIGFWLIKTNTHNFLGVRERTQKVIVLEQA